ncbi:hypothetical protein AJ88_20575 [Mesorhizobium amorphae CCBAU 01583]|nr:hypothetical protein AJ88_20575 [Mesorhizobium amorphae CCBAU 01583]
MKSYVADGQESKWLPDMPNPRKGSDDERPPERLELPRPLNSGTPNVAVIAIHCQLKICRLLAGQSRQSNMALSFSSKCPVNSLSRLC